MGVAYFTDNQLDKALALTAKGHQLLRAKKSETLGKIAYNLGFYHTQNEEYSVALPYFMKKQRCCHNPHENSWA